MTATLAWGSPLQVTASLARPGARLDVITDRTVLALDPVRQFVEGLSRAAKVRVFPDVTGPLDSMVDRIGDFDGDTVIAIGGGSVIDAAKMVRYLRASGTEALNPVQRCGLRVVPDVAPDAPRLVAVPTTVGTGAEASSGAVVLMAGRPTLVRGFAMLVDDTWYCRQALAELPRALRLRGAVEVLFRLLAPALEARGEARLPELTALSRAVLRAGERLHAGENDEDALATILQAGAFSHGSRAHRGLHPFGSRVWYVCNETTHALGLPKLDVLPALWLAALHLAGTGDLDWMPAARLRRVRVDLGLGTADEPMDAALAGVFRRWSVPTRLEPGDTSLASLVDTCQWRWGHGLPMLRRATDDDLSALLATAALAPWSPSSRGTYERVDT